MEQLIAFATLINVAITLYVALYVRAMRAELKADVLKEAAERFVDRELYDVRHAEIVKDITRLAGE